MSVHAPRVHPPNTIEDSPDIGAAVRLVSIAAPPHYGLVDSRCGPAPRVCFQGKQVMRYLPAALSNKLGCCLGLQAGENITISRCVSRRSASLIPPKVDVMESHPAGTGKSPSWQQYAMRNWSPCFSAHAYVAVAVSVDSSSKSEWYNPSERLSVLYGGSSKMATLDIGPVAVCCSSVGVTADCHDRLSTTTAVSRSCKARNHWSKSGRVVRWACYPLPAGFMGLT